MLYMFKTFVSLLSGQASYIKHHLLVQINEPVFTLNGERVLKDKNITFPLPWDVPLSAYGAVDEPWVHEYMQ